MRQVFVVGLAMHPAAQRISDKRLEEIVFDTARAALDDAGVSRTDIDNVTIAGCDELDGRSISSMLLSAPAGAYLRDEIKCTDSGLTGLVLGALRVQSGSFDLGLVVSWNQSSVAPFEDVMRMRCEPFYTRPVGLNRSIADALFAQAVTLRWGIAEADVNDAVIAHYRRAARNPRRAPRPIPTSPQIAESSWVATPLRQGQQAPITDGAVAMVLASEEWLIRHRAHEPLARIAGLGWRSERYSLGADRLANMEGLRAACDDALREAGLRSIEQLDIVELDSQTGYHALAYCKELGLDIERVSPSGGAFAQNPYFCAGLANAGEAVLQLAGRAGPIQTGRSRFAAAHGCHGFAQQGNVVAIFEKV